MTLPMVRYPEHRDHGYTYTAPGQTWSTDCGNGCYRCDRKCGPEDKNSRDIWPKRLGRSFSTEKPVARVPVRYLLACDRSQRNIEAALLERG